MPRQPGLHGDGGGFRVANFAHHDDLRVLPHDAAQGYGVGEVLRGIDLGLADHRQIKLHRVFHGADADAGAVALRDVAKRGIHRVGLAGAGGAGEQEQPAGTLEQTEQAFQRRLVEAERVQVEPAVARVEEADDDFLAARGGEDGDAQLHAVQFRPADGRAVLWHSGLVGDEVGHHLEAHGNFVEQFQRQVGDLDEDAVDAGADGDGGFPRLDVQVARAKLDGVLREAVDEHGDFNLLRRTFGAEIFVGVTHIARFQVKHKSAAGEVQGMDAIYLCLRRPFAGLTCQ